MFEQEQALLEKEIEAYCQKHDLPRVKLNWSWIPFAGEWGLSTAFFELAAKQAKADPNIKVPERATELAQKIAQSLRRIQGFSRVEAVKGYINFYFFKAEYARRVIDTVLTEGTGYGRGPKRNTRIMVEFSHPNTHKAFHVGHLRSAILGDGIARLLEFAGYDTVRANYPGDIGLHVVIWLWNYREYHLGEKPAGDITRWMGDLYAEARKRLEENPDLEQQVRNLYRLWDARDPEIVALWKETREWSLKGFRDLYRILDIRFDTYYFNSQMERNGKAIVKELLEKGIAVDERPDGAVVVKLDELLKIKRETYRVLVILRSDGTALYATEDLALAVQKFKDYPDLEKSIYIVDVRQSLHFLQVFKTLELAGYSLATKCSHVPYELVTLPGNVTMASREGTVVLLEDLIREATQRAHQIVEEKNPELPEIKKDEIASAVAIGAIKYPLLARENTKVVVFDWKAAMDINGQAAPYIQYAHVRANSILKKVSFALPEPLTIEYDLTRPEVELIDLLARFPQEVERAAEELRPLTLANLAYELAKAFNNFYTLCPVLQAEKEVQKVRLRLVAAARQTLANVLSVLGITAPQAM
jgi:arginyl-tRNA synthetase